MTTRKASTTLYIDEEEIIKDIIKGGYASGDSSAIRHALWFYRENNSNRRNNNKKLEMSGTVVFMWSKEDSDCICCGTPDVPHKHNFNRHIRLDPTPSEFFSGRIITDVLEFQSEVLHTLKDIENKRVRITIEVIEE